MLSINKIHPGEYIKDSLDVMNMTAKEFSLRTGISERTLSELINNKGSITFDVAYKLSKFFDNSINVWTNLQNQYELAMKEENKNEELKSDWSYISPIKSYLVENHYITNADSQEEIILKVKRLIKINDFKVLDSQDALVNLKEQKNVSNQNYFVQNFWIALALSKARMQVVDAFDKKKLLSYVPEIRAMTVMDPSLFYPRLLHIFKECGISYVLLPYLSKSNVYGATKWLNSSNVMLAMSNRGNNADLFWFTLFHEMAHVLLEHKRDMLLSRQGLEDAEADEWAANTLIPIDAWENFKSKGIPSIHEIKSFAKQQGVHPCIVLGRLHKEKTIKYGIYDNEIGVKYAITNAD